MAETPVPGVTVNEVARQHGSRSDHLPSRRRPAKDGKLIVPDLAGAEFTPAVLEPEAAPVAPPPGGVAEVVHGAVTFRLGGATSAGRIAEIAHALSAPR